MKEAKMTKKKACKECGSTNGYVRRETQDKVCRACGAITPLKQPKNAPHPPSHKEVAP